jgi:hypothetical protein
MPWRRPSSRSTTIPAGESERLRGRGGEYETGRVGDKEMGRIRTHRELEVYQMAFEAAMEIFEVTKGFPREETYSLTDQIRRSFLILS